MKLKTKILWIITVLPLLVTAVAVRFMEDSVPAHYDFYGNIDRWGSKYEYFLEPCFIILMTIFLQVLINYYKRKQKRALEDKEIQEAKNNEKVLYYVAVGITVMQMLIHCVLLYSAFISSSSDVNIKSVDIPTAVSILIGIFMIVIGNIIPKSKINGVVGLRTPWNMSDDRVWAESNRVGGVVMIIAGFLIVLSSIVIKGIATEFVTLGIIVASAIISTIYSYAVYKKYKNSDKIL